MPSEIIPSLDLAPSVPSRIVTVHATDVTKGTALAGKEITFRLRGDLRVPADGVIISTGEVTLTLDAEGKGRVRLPCYTDDTRADSADGEWYLEVCKSWVGQTDLIRIPTGSTTIALAAIEPVREIPIHLAPAWLVTGAGVEIVEGSQWAATVVVSGGVARFRFTVPPGGTAWTKGRLQAPADISALRGSPDAGVYWITLDSDAAALGLPEGRPGVLVVEPLGSTGSSQSIQTYHVRSSGNTWRRTIAGGAAETWNEWQNISGPGVVRAREALGNRNLDTIISPGVYWQESTNSATTARNYPTQSRGILTVLQASNVIGATASQTYHATLLGQVWVRDYYGSIWSPWMRLGGGGGDTGQIERDLATLAARVDGIQRLPAPVRTNLDGPFTPTVGPVGVTYYPTDMNRWDRTTMINFNSSVLRYSPDEGETWEAIHTFTDQPVRNGIFLENGEVLIHARGVGSQDPYELYLSKGFADDPHAATWRKVLTGPSTSGPSQAFSWSTYRNIVLMGEYGPKRTVSGTGEAARHLWASRDYGKTWQNIFDLLTDVADITIDTGMHIHGTLYDPYWDRIWITYGDDEQGTVFSDDWGQTWHTAIYTPLAGGAYQSVGMFALPNCVLLATDGHPNGVLRIPRTQGKHTGPYTPEVAYRFNDSTNLTHLCQGIWKADRPGDDAPVVFEFSAAPQPGKRSILTTIDGYRFRKVWEDTLDTRHSGDGRAFGPTATGRLLHYAQDDRFPGRTFRAGPMPTAY